ncbi:MAG: serine/threonine protein kinase [Calditrichaeota bacterium]|nr:MAG: serine/threonine protein kinase [Calditrichota bacterium]
MTLKNPYIVGNWVRGENFYGRQKLIHEILQGPRDYLWVAGTRRLGKTSLFKQVEYLTLSPPYSQQYIALFWDLQGSHHVEGLKETLLESVEDAEERFEPIGVTVDQLESLDLFSILRTLKRKTKDAQRKLLLLCDECEELINIEKNQPEVLPRLRRFFQQGENVRTILTATRRLRELEKTTLPETSPFLHGFIPPLFLSRLEDEAALHLIQKGGFSESIDREIMSLTNNHPYLIQLVCKRLLETGNLRKVVEEISRDEMVAHFFAVDFQNLEQKEKELLLFILQNQPASLPAIQARMDSTPEKLLKQIYDLVQLGYLKQSAKEGYAISNYFFEKWLEHEKEKLYTESTLQRIQQVPEKETTFESELKSLPKIGARIAQFEILEKLGTGGMGVVFRAKDTLLERSVALKLMLPQFVEETELKERFLLEAQAASKLNHPNITTIYQIGEETGRMFIVMELVEGLNLKEWQKKHEKDLDMKIDVALQIARGLAYAHQKGVIHRDIKADNIMVTQDNCVKIMDFGLAKLKQKFKSSITKTGATLGTLAYMSPEQASGLPVDHRTDIFSYGVVLYELLSGQLPFQADFELTLLYAILNEEPPPLRDLVENLPTNLDEIVFKALKKDRKERFQTMEEVIEALCGIEFN